MGSSHGFSKQYREHAISKRSPRLRTAVESKSVSTQGSRSLFPRARQFNEYNGKEALAGKLTLVFHSEDLSRED